LVVDVLASVSVSVACLVVDAAVWVDDVELVWGVYEVGGFDLGGFGVVGAAYFNFVEVWQNFFEHFLFLGPFCFHPGCDLSGFSAECGVDAGSSSESGYEWFGGSLFVKFFVDSVKVL